MLNFRFSWIIAAPVVNNDDINKYVKLSYVIVKSFVPGVKKTLEIIHLIATYKVHFHLKSCQKYKTKQNKKNSVAIILTSFYLIELYSV